MGVKPPLVDKCECVAFCRSVWPAGVQPSQPAQPAARAGKHCRRPGAALRACPAWSPLPDRCPRLLLPCVLVDNPCPTPGLACRHVLGGRSQGPLPRHELVSSRLQRATLVASPACRLETRVPATNRGPPLLSHPARCGTCIIPTGTAPPPARSSPPTAFTSSRQALQQTERECEGGKGWGHATPSSIAGGGGKEGGSGTVRK